MVEKESKRSANPSTAPLAQDEPPWLALAKKKAKAWSEMPQIVQWKAHWHMDFIILPYIYIHIYNTCEQ